MEMKAEKSGDTYLETSAGDCVHIIENGHYLIGYSRVEKHCCEVYNFISPTLRILRFTDGEAEWNVAGRILTYRAGDIVILNNMVKRNIHRMISETIAYEMFDFYPSVFLDSNLWSVYYGSQTLMAGPYSPETESIHQLLDMLRSEILKEKRMRCMAIRNLLSLLSLEFCRRTEPENVQIDHTMYHISQSLQYISEYLSDNITVAQLASECGYTAEHYSRLFKKYIGLSPMKYIIYTRIENTMKLVRSVHMTILDAAYQSGFTTASGFYKSFQAYYGMSPGRYLKQNGEEIGETAVSERGVYTDAKN